MLTLLVIILLVPMVAKMKLTSDLLMLMVKTLTMVMLMVVMLVLVMVAASVVIMARTASRLASGRLMPVIYRERLHSAT